MDEPGPIPKKPKKRDRRIMLAVAAGGLLALVVLLARRNQADQSQQPVDPNAQPSTFADNGVQAASLGDAVTQALADQTDAITGALADQSDLISGLYPPTADSAAAAAAAAVPASPIASVQPPAKTGGATRSGTRLIELAGGHPRSTPAGHRGSTGNRTIHGPGPRITRAPLPTASPSFRWPAQPYAPPPPPSLPASFIPPPSLPAMHPQMTSSVKGR